MGGAYVSFHDIQFTSRIGLVLGRSMLGVIPGDGVLYDAQAVRY